MDLNELIGRHPELEAVPDRLRRPAAEVFASAGEMLFRLGERPKRMFWVVEGEVRLVRRSRNGAEIVLQRSRSGFMAEASLDASSYHCDAVAAIDSHLLGFPVLSFRDALLNDEPFRAFWMQRLAREVRTLRAQCERLSLRGAAERIEHYVVSEGVDGRLQLRQTMKAWAAELGLTHEALYRAMAGLRRAGRIVTSNRGSNFIVSISRDHRMHDTDAAGHLLR
jgi:CRP-like cAMP-binding protein